MFGNLAEMAGLMKKAKDIQKNLGTMKEELAQIEISGSCPGDKVHALVSADMRLKKLIIAPEVTSDAELLEELVMVAVNNALDGAKQAAQEKLKEITGGINIPGLF